MPPPTITALPAYPVRGEDRATFATKANATVAAMPTMVTETNTLAEWIEDTVDAATAATAADVVSAESAKDDAEEAMTQAIAIAGTYTVINQGAHSTPPTTRNNGSALQVGDLYYDIPSEKMKIWS